MRRIWAGWGYRKLAGRFLCFVDVRNEMRSGPNLSCQISSGFDPKRSFWKARLAQSVDKTTGDRFVKDHQEFRDMFEA